MPLEKGKRAKKAEIETARLINKEGFRERDREIDI